MLNCSSKPAAGVDSECKAGKCPCGKIRNSFVWLCSLAGSLLLFSPLSFNPSLDQFMTLKAPFSCWEPGLPVSWQLFPRALMTLKGFIPVRQSIYVRSSGKFPNSRYLFLSLFKKFLPSPNCPPLCTYNSFVLFPLLKFNLKPSAFNF